MIIDCLQVNERAEQLIDIMHSKRELKQLFKLLVIKHMNDTWDLDSWRETYPDNLQLPRCSYGVTENRQMEFTLLYFQVSQVINLKFT